MKALQFEFNLPHPADADADLEAEVLRLLRQGKKIKAVKLYRDRRDAMLFDAKREVEEIAERHRITVEGAGCSGLVIVFIVAIVGVAVVAVWLRLG